MASLGSLISALFNSIKHGTGKETAAIEKEIRKFQQRLQIRTVTAPRYRMIAGKVYGSTMKNASMIAVQTQSNLEEDGDLNNLSSGLRGGLAEGVSNKVKSLKGEFDTYNSAGLG